MFSNRENALVCHNETQHNPLGQCRAYFPFCSRLYMLRCMCACMLSRLYMLWCMSAYHVERMKEQSFQTKAKYGGIQEAKSTRSNKGKRVPLVLVTFLIGHVLLPSASYPSGSSCSRLYNKLRLWKVQNKVTRAKGCPHPGVTPQGRRTVGGKKGRVTHFTHVPKPKPGCVQLSPH